MIVLAGYFSGTPAELKAEVLDIVESIRFVP
jgi:hypothetical protein